MKATNLTHPKELLFCLKYVADRRDVSLEEFFLNAISQCGLRCHQYRLWLARTGKRPFRVWPDKYICITPRGHKLLEILTGANGLSDNESEGVGRRNGID